MEEIKILDNGESEVQVATIGTVVGSDKDGNPIEQNFSEEALKRIAETQVDDILVDADHSSEKGGSTEAQGWLSKLKFVPGVGLIGSIKWTDLGRKLIENRVFRWLSPAWLLNDDKEPEFMTSCALTNKPSQYGRISPIVNSVPRGTNEEVSNPQEEIIDMTKEEVVQLIRETVAQIKAEKEAAEAEEAKKAAETQNEAVPEQKKEITDAEKAAEANNEEVPEKSEGEKLAEELKKAENACGAKNECGECKKEEVKNECGEEKKAEVIKEEVLNSQPIPQINQEAEWKKLSGKAFFDWLAKHPEAR